MVTKFKIFTFYREMSCNITVLLTISRQSLISNLIVKGGDILESTILEIALSQGLWAFIAVSLFLYIVKSNEKRDLRQEEREQQYQELIRSLTEKFSLVQQIQSDVALIKGHFLEL